MKNSTSYCTHHFKHLISSVWLRWYAYQVSHLSVNATESSEKKTLLIRYHISTAIFAFKKLFTRGCQKSSYLEANRRAVRPTNCISFFFMFSRERYRSKRVTVRKRVSCIRSNFWWTCEPNWLLRREFENLLKDKAHIC